MGCLWMKPQELWNKLSQRALNEQWTIVVDEQMLNNGVLTMIQSYLKCLKGITDT